jgi:hypothetical protein
MMTSKNLTMPFPHCFSVSNPINKGIIQEYSKILGLPISFTTHLDNAIDRATRTPVAGVPPLLLPLVPGLREMFLQNEKKEEK